MYICKIHGELETDWCHDCKEMLDEIDCSHSEVTSTRFKDMTYDSEEGEHTVTIYLYFCEKCGETQRVDFY